MSFMTTPAILPAFCNAIAIPIRPPNEVPITMVRSIPSESSNVQTSLTYVPGW
jgi:hypothetical protein